MDWISPALSSTHCFVHFWLCSPTTCFLFYVQDIFFLIFCFLQTMWNMRRYHQGLRLVPDFSQWADQMGKFNSALKTWEILCEDTRGPKAVFGPGIQPPLMHRDWWVPVGHFHFPVVLVYCWWRHHWADCDGNHLQNWWVWLKMRQQWLWWDGSMFLQHVCVFATKTPSLGFCWVALFSTSPVCGALLWELGWSWPGTRQNISPQLLQCMGWATSVFVLI